MTDNVLTHDEPQETDEIADTAARLAGTALGIGRLWAAHGLEIGRAALQTSALTLQATAEVLGELADRAEPGSEE